LDFIQALRPVDFRWDLREDYRSAPPVAPAQEASKLANLSHDGGQRRTRFHHGLIAQEVAEVMAQTGIDFGGYQDRTINGGDDVRSLGYDEFIAPLIKAVQELAAQNASLAMRNDDLAAEIAQIRAALSGIA
jgi:hypothetical protein